jgi:RND family efflux transporter MFP subunit
MTKRSIFTGFLALLLLSGAIMAFMALVGSKPGATAKPPRERIWSVDSLVARPAAHHPELRLYGRVESPRTAMLSAPMTADVIAVPVREGQEVEPDQTLILLDPRDRKLELAQRQADVAQLQAQIDSEFTRYQSDQHAIEYEKTLLKLTRQALERSTTLKRRKLGSDSELDQASQALARQQLALNTRQREIQDHPARLAQLQARLERARALRDLAELELQRTTLSAPFAGRIAEVMVSPGARVRPGEQLLEVYDTAKLEIRAQIPETTVPMLRQGLQHQGRLEACAELDGLTLQLRLERLAGRVEPGRGGVEGLFSLERGDLAPRLGRFVDLTLKLPEQADTIAVPGSAIYGTHRVYKIVDQRLQSVVIERVGRIADHGDTLFLIRSPDLKAGDHILTTQLANAIDGLKVQAGDAVQPGKG